MHNQYTLRELLSFLQWTIFSAPPPAPTVVLSSSMMMKAVWCGIKLLLDRAWLPTSHPLSPLATSSVVDSVPRCQTSPRLRLVGCPYCCLRSRALKVKAKGPSHYNFISLNLPLKPRSLMGKFLSGVLQNHHHLFHIVARMLLNQDWRGRKWSRRWWSLVRRGGGWTVAVICMDGGDFLTVYQWCIGVWIVFKS